MTLPLPTLISSEQFQAGLDCASHHCGQPDAGLFGPGSVSWQLLRENLSSLAQGRVLLLALARPRLGQRLTGVHETQRCIHHSGLFLLKLVFGNLDQVLATLDCKHTRNRTLFALDDSESLLYMLSGWMDSALAMYESVVGPLSTALHERLFEETMLLAMVLGIPSTRLPPDWHAHRRWWQAQLNNPLRTGKPQQAIANTLLREQGYPDRIPYGSYRPLASYQLPEHWQPAFGLPARNLDNHRRYQHQLKRLMERTRYLPARLRYQPAWHEANQRLRGRPRADLTTRLLSRWWTGESELVSSGWSVPKVARWSAADYR